MKSTLKNMVLVLFIITLISSAAVSGVYILTKEPIELARNEAKVEAMRQVLPPFNSSKLTEMVVDELPIMVHRAYYNGEIVGYAIQSITRKGYSGNIEMMVGFTPEGEVLNINILSHKETPGLGAKITDTHNALIKSVQGRNLYEFKLALRKDGGEVDGLTAATITSAAYIDALSRAHKAAQQIYSDYDE